MVSFEITPKKKGCRLANCIDCNEKIPIFHNGIGGRCASCTRKHRDTIEAPERERQAKHVAEQEAQAAKEKQVMDSVLVTTEQSTNLNILQRLKIVISTVDSAFDARLVEKQDELIFELKRGAYLVGGNAVVGVNISIVETYSATLGGGEFKKFKMVAYGTAVLVGDGKT